MEKETLIIMAVSDLLTAGQDYITGFNNKEEFERKAEEIKERLSNLVQTPEERKLASELLKHNWKLLREFALKVFLK